MKNSFIVIVFLVLLVSCSNDDVEVKADAIEQQVTSVSVLCQQRKAAQGIDTEEQDDAIINNGFTSGDRLYFSQRTVSADPNFNPENKEHPLYVYEYDESDESGADWDNGYNFLCLDGTTPFDWKTVEKLGSVGNAFSMFAFHFPVENQVRFYVETDQRGNEGNRYAIDNFKKSDIMGAYHATSSLYTRLRFRLFHLMVYLKVTLYVPVFESSYQSETDAGFSGFDEGAMQEAFVMNASTGFDIEWSTVRSSDIEPPHTKPVESTKNRIYMYCHEPDEGNTKELDVTDFYTGDNITKDKVREYNFSVLFPEQNFGANNFLCFVLKGQEGDNKYYYYKNGNQVSGNDERNYSLTQGTLQQLYLYLPRKTNETILVGAKILPWKDATTGMTVTKDGNQNKE